MRAEEKVAKILYTCKKAPKIDWRLVATMLYSDCDVTINFIAKHCKELEGGLEGLGGSIRLTTISNFEKVR